ncbi:PLC-like phosphodiesterase [Chlamydoabsidia padenii]|nr:PLC-like phosphodiesterase [Chlamydoabsidia padenii]
MTIETTQPKKTLQVIAHRGFSGQYAENTIISFEKAIEAGTTALEGDIRLSKDGELVMMHDLTLQRTTTGTGAVSDHPWFGHIDGLKTKTDPAQPISRLNDVLDVLLRHEVAIKEGFYMIVDVKFDNDITILDKLYTLLEEDYKDHVETLRRQIVIGIWHHDFLAKTQALFDTKYKTCFIGLSLTAARRRFLDHVDYLSIPFAALADDDGQQFIDQVHTLNKKVFTWTINEIEQMTCARMWGLDGIVGDHVDVMVKQMESMDDSLAKIGHRRRWYYYLVKKVMNWGSSSYIGV